MKLLLLTLILTVVGCSGSKPVSSVEELDSGIQLTDSEEFAEGTEEDDIVAENTEEVDVAADAMLEDGDESVDIVEASEELSSEPIIEEQSKMESYRVQKNETLMIIAFKLYGDYSMWKKISSVNDGLTSVTEGMNINYEKPVEMFVWAPEGNKYLIKSGDTLGKISDESYGTAKHWKDIWNNNKPLIKDPNKIYAGFTIFTPLISGREVANN